MIGVVQILYNSYDRVWLIACRFWITAYCFLKKRERERITPLFFLRKIKFFFKKRITPLAWGPGPYVSDSSEDMLPASAPPSPKPAKPYRLSTNSPRASPSPASPAAQAWTLPARWRGVAPVSAPSFSLSLALSSSEAEEFLACSAQRAS